MMMLTFVDTSAWHCSWQVFEIQEASDALVALNLIQQDPPDLVVLDLNLPTISGRAVHENLTATTATRHIPIVVVTDSTEVHDFPGVLRKPVTPDTLIETVNNCLAGPRRSRRP